MRIGILGGTGDLGKGLAFRWCRRHDVLIGSRQAARGRTAAAAYAEEAGRAYGSEARKIRGDSNETAARADVLVLALPAENSVDYLRTLKARIAPSALAISPVVPMRKTGNAFTYLGFPTPAGPRSMAEAFAQELHPVRVVAGFHTVPAGKLADPRLPVEADVFLAGDDPAALKTVASLVREIPNLRPLNAGPLLVARLIEPLTPLLLNVGIQNKFREPSLRVV